MTDLLNVFKDMRKHILAGVSYLIPVVVVGGIMTGLGVALGGTTVWENVGTFPAFLFTLGKTGLNLMPAVIGAYIAYSIADKPALGPGFIVGQMAQDCGAGFLGGVFAGVFCGIVVLYLKKIKVGKNFTALMSIIIIPCIATILGAIIMNYAVGELVVNLVAWLTTFIEGLGTANMVVVAIAFGIIGSFDLGLFGSKAIGAVCLAMLSTIDPATGMPVMIAQQTLLMCLTPNVVPPLVCALATFIKPKIFTAEEREAGKAALFLGAFGITEGAIPLALADMKVYAGCIVGAVIGTICTALFGAGTIVNWAGIPTFPGCTSVPLYVAAIAIGTVAGACFIVLFKHETSDAQDDNEEVIVTKKGEEFNLDF